MMPQDQKMGGFSIDSFYPVPKSIAVNHFLFQKIAIKGWNRAIGRLTLSSGCDFI